MDDAEARAGSGAATLQIPSQAYTSPLRRSLEEIMRSSRSSIYEEAEESLGDESDTDEANDLDGMDQRLPSAGRRSASLQPPPVSSRHSDTSGLSESSVARIQAREWWFDVKESMRTQFQYWGHQSAQDVRAGPNVQHSAVADVSINGKEHPAEAGEEAGFPERAFGLNGQKTEAGAFFEVSTGYHKHLVDISPRFPEALMPVHYALRALGGRWSVERRSFIRDEVFHISISKSGEPTRGHIDCTNEKQFKAFRSMLATARSPDDESFNIIVLPDLSPLVVEVLGGLLHLDHRVFANHIWSQYRRPFHVANRRAFDTQANTDDPARTTLIDVDTDAVMYMVGGGSLRNTEKRSAKQRWLKSYRHGPSFFPLLDRAIDEWPEDIAPPSDVRHELSSSFHAPSRTTIHYVENKRSPIQVIVMLTPSNSWALEGESEYIFNTIGAQIYCQDFGDPFLKHESGAFSPEKPLSRPSEEDRYCSELEEFFGSVHRCATPPTDPELLCLHWLSAKFVSATAQLQQADSRRLAYFRRRRQALAKSTNSAAAASDHDPLLDLQYLRAKATKRVASAAKLDAKLSWLLSEHDCAHHPAPGPVHAAAATLRALRALQSRIAQHLSDLSAIQGDISAALARSLTLLQLEESRKSIAQGAMVGKLTVLAFIFVPISATSSAFGMNLAELLAHPPPAWSFGLTAAGVSALMLAFAGADWAANVLAGAAGVVRGARDKGLPARGARRGVATVSGTMKVGVAVVRGLLALVDALAVLTLPLRALMRVLAQLHEAGREVRGRQRKAEETAVQRRLAFRWRAKGGEM